jgi:hypothetical protein
MTVRAPLPENLGTEVMLKRDLDRLDKLSLQMEACYRQAYLETKPKARQSFLRDAHDLDRMRRQVVTSQPALAWLVSLPVIPVAPWTFITIAGHPLIGGAVGITVFLTLCALTWRSYRREK